MPKKHSAVDRFYLAVGRFPVLFFAAVAATVAVCTGAVAYQAVGGPPRVASIEEAFVAESSRDIDGSPTAVVERRDGSQEFVSGVYVAGEPVTLTIDSEGEVIPSGGSTIWWMLLAVISVCAGLLAMLPAAFLRLHVVDSERMWRLDRRIYYDAVQ